MNNDVNRFSLAAKRLGANGVALVAFSACSAFAAETTLAAVPAVGGAAPARVEVPDGAPQLAKEMSINNMSASADRSSDHALLVEEERVQGRLATAKVSVAGGKGYMVVDPAVGRTDRPADNAGKRVSPPLWELFRF